MVYVRSLELKTGRFHYVVTGRHEKPIPCGTGSEALEYAQELAVEIRKAKRDAKAGRPMPVLCAWTLADARNAHLEDARRRGLRTALPQFHGRQSKLESHWNNLFRFFAPDEYLDRVTAQRIRACITFMEQNPNRRRSRGAGPGTINQALFFVLKPALEIARGRAEAAFTGDPFAGMEPLAIRRERDPIVLSSRQLTAIVVACWKRHAPLGAHVELLRLTASRLREEPELVGGMVRFPPYKLGNERLFQLRGRLSAVLKAPRAFSYAIWKEAARAAGLPGLNPHDLRHSVLTELGHKAGMTLGRLQNYGGWKSPAMAQKYLHRRGAALSTAGVQQRVQQRST